MKRWIILIAYVLVLMYGCAWTWQKRVQREFVVQDADGNPIAGAEVYTLFAGDKWIDPFCLQCSYDEDTALQSWTKSAADGSFCLDMSVYYPHQHLVLVAADGYYPTVMPLMADYRQVVLLDRKRYRGVIGETFETIKEKELGEIARIYLAEHSLWLDAIHNENYHPGLSDRVGLVREGLYIPTTSMGKVIDRATNMMSLKCPLLHKYDFWSIPYDDTQLLPEEREILQNIEDEENLPHYIPVFFQSTLTPKQRRSLNLPADTTPTTQR